MQRTYPGQLPSIRRNIHHLVVPIDFSDMVDVQIVVGTIQTLIKRTVPVRFGLVPITKTAASNSQAKVALHILQTYGIGGLFGYLESVRSSF
jgi:UDP-glucose:glycoprotein glucosyltransferase